jgi:hypothetical protein
MSSGFSYPRPIFTSPIYNPAFYLTLDASGYLTYEYAQTLYLDKNDYRLTYITGITQGTATQGVALVPGINNDISGIGALSCSSLTVNGSSVSSPPSYVLGITPGQATTNKALVLGASGEIATIVSLTATNIYGSIKTAAQPSITSLGTLAGLTTKATATTSNISLMSDYALALMNSNSTNGEEVGLCFGVSSNAPNVYAGGASIVHKRVDTNSAGGLRFNVRNSPVAADPLVEAFRINADASSTFNYPMTIDGNLSFSGAGRVLSGLSSISATTLTGTLSTAAQTAITSVGSLNGLNIDGNLTFTGASRTITGLSSISATTLTGAASGAQTGITAVGILSNLTLSTGGIGLQIPNLKFYNSTTVSYDNFNHSYYLSVVEGGCVASKALVVDSNKDIGSIRTLNAVNINGSTSVSRTLGNFGSISIGGSSIITNDMQIKNISDITCSGTMNAFAGYQLNGATLVDSTQNVFAASVLADYAQLDKAAPTTYSSTSKSNEYNLVLSQASNTSATYSGMAFHVDTSGLSVSIPGACIISERNSTTAYDGSSISFCTKGAAGAGTAPTKRMTITKTGAINFGDGVSTDGDLLLIKSAASPLFRFGSALSTKNCISLQWEYAGAAFDANRLHFDILWFFEPLIIERKSTCLH